MTISYFTSESLSPFLYIRQIQYPYSRILIKINTLDDYEGQILAVSDSAESDDDLCEKLHEFLDNDILCIIVGSYVQGGSQNVIYSVR